MSGTAVQSGSGGAPRALRLLIGGLVLAGLGADLWLAREFAAHEGTAVSLLLTALGLLGVAVTAALAPLRRWPITIALASLAIAQVTKLSVIAYALRIGDESLLRLVVGEGAHPLASPEAVRLAWRTAALGSVGAMLAALPIALFGREKGVLPAPDSGADQALRRLAHPAAALAAVAVLMLTSGITFAVGAGVRGGEVVSLPYRLGGVLYYAGIAARTVCAGVLASPYGAARLKILVVGVLALEALLSGWFQGSRGALVMAGVFAGLAMVHSGRRLGRGGLLGLLGLVALGIVLRPVLTIVRMGRVLGVLDFWTLVSAFRSSSAEEVTQGFALDAVLSVVFRFIGSDSVVMFYGSRTPRMPSGSLGEVLLGSVSVTDYFTQYVIGYPPGTNHYSAPSLLGALDMIGGLPLVVMGVALALATYAGLYSACLRAPLLVGRGLAVQVLLMWLGLMSDGYLERVLRDLLGLALAACILELALRLVTPARSAPRAAPVTGGPPRAGPAPDAAAVAPA